MRNLFIATQFLTRISIGNLPNVRDVKPKDLAGSMSFFPLLGAFIGCVLAGIYYLSGLLIVDKPLILAAQAVAASFILTGGLQTAGLIKTIGSLVAGKTKKEMLVLMEGESAAPAGILAAICILLMKFALIGALTKSNAFGGLVLMACAGRAFMVLGARFYPPARVDGAKQFMEFVGIKEALFSVITVALFSIILASLKGWMILLVTFISFLIVGTYLTKRIGGMTVDTLGAINEITETIFLFLFVLIP